MWQARGYLAKVPTLVAAAVLVAGLAIDAGRFSAVPPIALIAWPAALLLASRLAFMGGAAMRWLGDRSYAIYLIHIPVLTVLKPLIGPLPGGLLPILVAVAAFAAVTLLLADLSFRFVETPARRAIRGWWSRRSQGSEAPVGAV